MQTARATDRHRESFRTIDCSRSAIPRSIVDAFDSMTSEQVFRRALSRERAIAELFECAGTQFDPVLVKEFATLIMQPAPQLEALLVRRWLSDRSVSLRKMVPSCGNTRTRNFLPDVYTIGLTKVFVPLR